MTSFSDILSTPMDTIEAPKPMPVGTYLCAVKGLPKQDERSSAKGHWDTIDFTLTVLAAQEDVDSDALADFGAVQGKELRQGFMFDRSDEENRKNSMFRLGEFLKSLGVEPTGKTLAQAINETPGTQVLATVKWRPDTATGRVYTEIKSTAKV